MSAALREAPWLADPVLELLEAMDRGHLQAFGLSLLPVAADCPARLRAQELFVAPRVVLAHDGQGDPRLIYANRDALRLWRRSWAAMVGLPSRLTAEPDQRPARAQALAQAQAGSQGGIRGYGGIRIDSHGRRFRLQGARIWSLRRPDGSACGQAAAFSDWWWL
jgi:hypothetical protein